MAQHTLLAQHSAVAEGVRIALLFGVLLDLAVGGSRLLVNVENLGDVRQTKEDPLVRRARGRRALDAWAPLEGRTLNAGVRIRF